MFPSGPLTVDPLSVDFLPVNPLTPPSLYNIVGGQGLTFEGVGDPRVRVLVRVH